MKFYFLFPLVLLLTFCLSSLAFSQEDAFLSSSALAFDRDSSIESSSSDPQNEHTWKYYPESSDDPSLTDQIHHEADTFQSKFFNMLFILGLLIGFMVLASWSLKRMMKAKMTNLNTASTIKVLETRYLSPRATLYLVEIQNQHFLIAESPTSVTYLASLPQEEASVSNRSSRHATFPPVSNL